MTRTTYLLLLFTTLFTPAAFAEVFDVDTYLHMQDVSEISVSPDGQFVAYTLYERDLEQDLVTTSVWMIPTAGGPAVPMTAGNGNSYTPKWSPDNRFYRYSLIEEINRTRFGCWTVAVAMRNL